MNTAEKITRVKSLLRDALLGFDEPIDVVTFSPDGEYNLLHEAAMRGSLEAAKLLVELGIDIDALGDMNRTPLHCAAAFRHSDIYEYLISVGARTDIIDQFGKTAEQSWPT